MTTQCLLDHMETGEPPDDSPMVYGCGGCQKLAKSTKRSPCGHSLFIFKSLVYNKVMREICRFCSLALGIGSLFIGLKYRYSCHFEPAIPIFLIVLGSVLILQTVFRTLLLCRPKMKVVEGEPERLDTFQMLIKIQVLFLVLWALAGSVWIYGAKGVVQFWEPKMAHYCNITVFWTAFGVVTSAYSGVLFIVVYFILTYVILKCYSDQRTKTVEDLSCSSSTSSSNSINSIESNSKTLV